MSTMTATEMNELVRVGIDSYHGRVTNYASGDAQVALRNALIDLNGGSTKLDIRKIRDGECKGLFSVVEQILAGTIADALTNNAFIEALVDFRNIAAGDTARFLLQNADLFEVAETATGTQALRRQRLLDTEVDVRTKARGVRIYEELDRVLAGLIDFNELINRVAASFRNEILNDTYSLWAGATQADLGGSVYFPAAGTYSEDALLEVVQHVEAAANGSPAIIIGTKRSLRPLIPSIVGNDGKNVIDKQGYVGTFFGSKVVCVPQRHKAGTTTFVFNDKEIVIMATAGDKPIKLVYEGKPLIINRAPDQNFDLTQEYLCIEKWGTALAMAGNSGIGRYQFT